MKAAQEKRGQDSSHALTEGIETASDRHGRLPFAEDSGLEK